MAERRRAQEAKAATVLAAALACLRGPGVAREPREALAAAALARPTLKTMQTALHLLHLRIRGPARTKKVCPDRRRRRLSAAAAPAFVPRPDCRSALPRSQPSRPQQACT